jgi:hypothetical protein
MAVTSLAGPVHSRLRGDTDDRRTAASDDLLKVYREMLAPSPFSLPSKSS